MFVGYDYEDAWPPGSSLTEFTALRYVDNATPRLPLPLAKTLRRRIWLAASLMPAEFSTDDLTRRYACAATTVRDALHAAVKQGLAARRAEPLANGQPKYLWRWR